MLVKHAAPESDPSTSRLRRLLGMTEAGAAAGSRASGPSVRSLDSRLRRSLGMTNVHMLGDKLMKVVHSCFSGDRKPSAIVKP